MRTERWNAQFSASFAHLLPGSIWKRIARGEDVPIRALRFIVEERLGDPASAASGSVELVKKYLREGAPAGLESQVDAIPVQALVVFTHPNAQVVAKDAPVPVFQPDKLLKKIPHPGQKMAPELYKHVRGRLDALLPSSE